MKSSVPRNFTGALGGSAARAGPGRGAATPASAIRAMSMRRLRRVERVERLERLYRLGRLERCAGDGMVCRSIVAR